MSLFDWLFGKKQPPCPTPRCRPDPFYGQHLGRKVTLSKLLDYFGTNGKLYCSKNCVKRNDTDVLCTISRKDYTELQRGSCPPGPKCFCGMLFNSWR